MPEAISIQDTGKEFKVEAKYSLQDLGIENAEAQAKVNQKVEALMSERTADILANPPKKWLGMRIDRDMIKAKLEEHAATVDALVKAHKDEIVKLGTSTDLNLDAYNLGETMAKEVKAALNAKVDEIVKSAEKRGIGDVVGGGAKEATKSYAQRLEDAANSK